MSIQVSIHDGDVITLNKFLYMYHLKPSTHYGYFELLPWNRESRIICIPTSFRDQKSRYFFISGSRQEIMSDNLWGEVPCLLQNGKSLLTSSSLKLLFLVYCSLTPFFFLFLQFLIVPCWRNITKDELRLPLSLSSQLTILTNWLILVICLGPEPSTYILRKISQEEKSRF